MEAVDINRYQRSGVGHALTCRECRGWGECERRDVGVVAGDHHVLEARDRYGAIVLKCECCGVEQDLDVHLATFIESWLPVVSRGSIMDRGER